MRLGKYTYRFSLLLTVSMSMVLLMKINKISFYHHYFKVIEEVEVRNSQALGAYLATYESRTANVSPFLQIVLNTLGLGLFTLILSIPFLPFSYRYPWSEGNHSSIAYLRSYPIRAP